MAGYVGAAIGLVLGTLRLPLILLLSGNPASAAGTNVAISAAAAASGSIQHARSGRVDWRVVVWMAPPSVAGALIGALFGHTVPERFLLAAISVVLGWNGVDLLFRPVRERPRSSPRLAPAAGFGFVIGVIGGAIGVILGTLRVPALLRASAAPCRVAGSGRERPVASRSSVSAGRWESLWSRSPSPWPSRRHSTDLDASW